MSDKRAGPYSYDDDYVPSKAVKYSKVDEDPAPAKVKVHTLDSDEEDPAEQEGSSTGAEKELKEDDIEGQEDQTVVFEGETTITPFNMKEEMEEGHFDGDGFYHFKKDSELIKDAWLDDVDWIKVKHGEENVNKYGSDVDSSDEEEEEGSTVTAALLEHKTLDIYRHIIELLKPGETVTKALKRLGGGKKLTSAQKWKLKKQKPNSNGEGTSGDMQQMLRLSELSNKIVESGNMDVYGETYEMITVKLKPKTEEAVMDMFGEGAKPTDDKTEGEKTTAEEKSTVDEVRWQLKWENTDDAEIHGPFPSTQMVKWQDTGYLDKGAYVRKTADKEGSWYHTKRIDFELYI